MDVSYISVVGVGVFQGKLCNLTPITGLLFLFTQNSVIGINFLQKSNPGNTLLTTVNKMGISS
jgi:hypothetical protein